MVDDALISKILKDQDAYVTAPPQATSRLTRGLSRPLAALTHQMIPPAAVEAALISADWVAGASIRRAAIGHDFADLRACEAAADDIRRWAIGYAATSGGAAGALGAAGLAIDIPATITLALRTARLTGLTYGFGGDGTAERVFILDILGLAAANSKAEKSRALARLEWEQADMAPDSWGKIVVLTGQSTGAMAAMRRVATALGVNLESRKIAQLTPIVGAVVGAGVNASFQSDVARAARYGYRVRWLAQHEKLISSEATPL